MTLTALLGPTNTGKTHLALERLLEHGDGVVGLPLRLLAREVYDRLCAKVGSAAVALVTGEEKIVPAGARYFACTVEAMPETRGGRPFECVIIDEVQLCADPERGHVFSQRLLTLRGEKSTLWCGSDAMAPLLRRLFPTVQIESRPRFSTLRYAGHKKLAKLKARSAVVCFRVPDVYQKAEELRRSRGGAAVVLGALSPRTRNAQVQMFQEGSVDVLVATDAIGMGLNLDIDHVAFASLRKFDGEQARGLTPMELCQIAGRAVRHVKDGSFGVTAEAPALAPELIERVERQQVPAIPTLVWRNDDLDVTSVDALLSSLRSAPPARLRDHVIKGRTASDVLALEHLWQRRQSDPLFRAAQASRSATSLLWQACQVPDYRKIGADDHAALVWFVFEHVHERGVIDDDVADHALHELERDDGDIDTLVARIAHVRTWTYLAHQELLADAPAWQERTRVLEDRLSDALHARLTLRFVDRLARVMVTEGPALQAQLEGKDVHVAGERLGSLSGLRFVVDGGDGGPTTPSGRERSVMKHTAALRALRQTVADRASELLEAQDGAFVVDARGAISSDGAVLARLVRGSDILRPQVVLVGADLADVKMKERLTRRLQETVHRQVQTTLGPLWALNEGGALEGAARGVAWQLAQGLGLLDRDDVIESAGQLSAEQKRALHKLGVRLGFFAISVDGLRSPAAVTLRSALFVAFRQLEPAQAEALTVPPAGAVSFPLLHAATPLSEAHLRACGYLVDGARAYRVDMIDKVLIELKKRAPPFAFEPLFPSLLGCSNDEALLVLSRLGYVARPRVAEDAPLVLERRRRRAS